MKINFYVFKSLFIICLCFFSMSGHAQKLPAVQQGSVRAPENIKVDGKPDEWNNKFQAYNNATDIYYTLANDDEKLYLVVQATDPDIINRVVGGGITLGIQKSGKKNENGIMNITYPVTERRSTMIFLLRGKKGVVADTSARAADSVMKRNNLTLMQKSKWIITTGIEGLDTMTSVYNEDGIKGASLFNIKKVYTLELSVTLKNLKLAKGADAKFAYHIRVNGMKNMFGIMTFTPAAGSTPEQIVTGEKMIARMQARMDASSSPTDFWGEYVLR